MDENDEQTDVQSSYRRKETFQRAQEVDHRFPNSTGVVPVPRGSRGPRSLYLRRYGDSFGFTLRHFIVYPPDSITEHHDGRHAAVGALLSPMDTIFVKHVKDSSPAKQAGLQRGDRLLAVNGEPVKDKTYSQVVQLIVNSPDYLHLLVVPKEEDVLQRFFADTAHNPISNQPPTDRQSAQKFLSAHLSRGGGAPEFKVDAISWRSLQQPYSQADYSDFHGQAPYERGQRSVDSLLYGEGAQDIYAEIRPHGISRASEASRAAPQVPLYRKMGRRASEGSTLEGYEPPDYSGLSGGYEAMKTMYKSNYLGEEASGYPNAAGCRLSLDVGRRESTSSLSSSIAEGSKDSLASYDSASTLTGHETDDSAIMTRYRKSFQQKEEFLRSPVSSVEQALIRREFYGRPKKLEKPMWPPTEPKTTVAAAAAKPIHQNFQRVKSDIEHERDLGSGHNGHQGGEAAFSAPQQRLAASPKDRNDRSSEVFEAETAPSGYDSLEAMNGSSLEDAAIFDDRRLYPPALQIVHKRAKDFESGRPLPEDDPLQSNRMNFSRSELARLSSKKLVPNVCERAYEYEKTKVEAPPRKAATVTSSSAPSVLKRIQRDSRSLDSSDVSNDFTKVRARSNSAESRNLEKERGTRRISRQDAITDRNKVKERETIAAETPTPPLYHPPYADLPPLIPEPVEHIQITPTVSITPAPPSSSPLSTTKAVRPNQLDLESNLDDKPVVVKRRPKNTNIADDERAMRRESYLRATEVGRMHIDSDMSDREDVNGQNLRSAHRRWRPPLFPGDIQQLRKLFEDAASSLGGSASSSSASLDREKASASPIPLEKESFSIVKEGNLHCKILEIDGKRAADRSWRQVYALLKGPKFYLYKDRHHQSPIGTSDALDQSLSSGVDMRTSVVRVAEDYTKRKNVLGVSSVKPCRSEFLLQADSTEDFADWVKTLQEQVAASTDAELDPLHSKQQAVPQSIPASTTIQVQGSHLSPQLSKNKATASRNRSPTGQSPVSKSRKPSQVPEPTSISPKSKTWRGRMVKQFRKFNQGGGNSPNSPTAPEGSTFGIPLEECVASSGNAYVPRFVEVCTDIIDQRGLQTVGIYRVPGNNASITALTEEINKNYEDMPLDDPKWNDLHVVSSLLKSYFRKMPDSLITVQLYPSFIKSDKIENPKARMEELKRLVRSLPKHNYHTLKHIILHLKRVADNSEVNRMEAKNLAIVFGPTIVRPEGENMESMVSHMTNQCKIVETLLTHADWFFSENEDEENQPVPELPPDNSEDYESGNNQDLLRQNISKYEALKDPKEKNGALFSSIISAAQRKVKRKPNKGSCSLPETKDEPTSPTNLKIFPTQSFSHCDLKESTSPDGGKPMESIPTTVMDIEKKTGPTEKMPGIYYYTSDKDKYEKRIQNFKQETEAMLQLPRKMEISVNNIDSRTMGQYSSSAGNVNQNPRLSIKPEDIHLLTKTHSASNVFSRTHNHGRNSLSSMDSNSFSVQYNSSNGSAGVAKNGGKVVVSNGQYAGDVNMNKGGGGGGEVTTDKRTVRCTVRRGSSVENVNSGAVDVSNGNLKKIKYESENENQRTGSLDSLNKLPNDDESLLSTMTKLIDEKLKEKHSQAALAIPDDIPYVDESPEKPTSTGPRKSHVDKENIPDLYRNPSLHKSHLTAMKELKNEREKEDDETMVVGNVPDNDRNVGKTTLTNNNNNNNSGSNKLKLKRSESLNKERTVSPMNGKLKRSESLNKAESKLKRSDSLTKSEKTENNNNKRREISNRRFKETTKNKRKNGMPDRSIKRRHTVGGTKDPDKVTWVMDNKDKEETEERESSKEKGLRTSSPDLSSSRRDKFFFEISLIDPENVVVALRQHLTTRPQSFPESTALFKVPLESHV